MTLGFFFNFKFNKDAVILEIDNINNINFFLYNKKSTLQPTQGKEEGWPGLSGSYYHVKE
jgi:hypothetical protein